MNVSLDAWRGNPTIFAHWKSGADEAQRDVALRKLLTMLAALLLFNAAMAATPAPVQSYVEAPGPAGAAR
jgi:hypothetical protein